LLKHDFKGGVHPKGHKELSSNMPLQRLALPEQVLIPLVQHIGPPCKPLLGVGDNVKTGQRIAESEKFISAPIHASISGKVRAIKKIGHPVLGACEGMVIDSDARDDKAYTSPDPMKGIDSFSPEDIKQKIKDSGIVGMGGAAFPTHVKLNPPADKPIDIFILNGAECEPYLTCDDRMMQEHASEVLQGMLLLMRSIGVGNGFIAIEDNKPKAIEAMRAAIADLCPATYSLQLKALPTKYPQGGEKQLIKTLTGREVPALKLPFDIGCLVDNVQTAFAVYEAVVKNKPLYERALTVTGDAINKPANIIARIGTPISFILANCQGIHGALAKLIIGGPMMGIAQHATDIPIIKGVSGILALSRSGSEPKDTQYCIRCGKCKESCPARLIPTEIAKAAEYSRFDIATKLNATDCIECGCCSYVCPSNIPLVQLIKHAKRSIACQI